ncbi:MAG: hypothetical protein ACXWLA_10340, partial [Myxococcaceae bacterium]
TAALALCLPLTGLAQSPEKTSGGAKTTAAQPGGDAKSSTDKSSPSAADAGVKKGHTMKPHAASAPAAPKSASDAPAK